MPQNFDIMLQIFVNIVINLSILLNIKRISAWAVRSRSVKAVRSRTRNIYILSKTNRFEWLLVICLECF